MIAAGLPVMSARDDAIALDEHSSNSWIRARLSQSLSSLRQGRPHEFFVRILLRHELKVVSNAYGRNPVSIWVVLARGTEQSGACCAIMSHIYTR
jgi:hypothetical protein